MCAFFKKIWLRIKEWSDKEYQNKYISALSPVYPENYNKEEYDVYKDYLKKAFKDSNVRNIAITGNYGIGKSSFVKKWSENKKYLFISLCSFSKNASKNLECDLLQQLLLGCGYVAEKDEHIEPERSLWTKLLIWIFAISATVTIYMLTFFNIFAPILEKSEITLTAEQITKIKFVAYGCFSFSIIVGLPMVIYKIIQKFRLTKIALKIEGAEIEAQRGEKSPTTCLDRYRLDLVCVLRKAARKLDYTIVFEDMDRLEMEDCQALFTELRELNRLINIRGLGMPWRKKTMRFVYVMHDAVFCSEKPSADNADAENREKTAGGAEELLNLKFFDYIMPIVPSMVDISSSNYITEMFEAVGFRNADFIRKISIYLSDYRLIKNITNEYAVLKDVYLKRTNSVMNELDEAELMALVIYKVMFPSDYKKIREGKSEIISFSGVSDSGEATRGVLKCLINNLWLSIRCFKFVGYDLDEIKKFIARFFDEFKWTRQHDETRRRLLRENFVLCSEVIVKKIHKNEDISLHLSGVCYTLLSRILNINKSFYFNGLLKNIPQLDDSFLEECGDNHKSALTFFMKRLYVDNDNPSDKLLIVLKYLTQINHTDYNWFFENSDGSDEKAVDRLRWIAVFQLDEVSLRKFVSECSDKKGD